MQTKRVRRAICLVWASVVLIGQGGLWPVAGAPQSYLGEQAADSVPSTETRLTRAPDEGDGAAMVAAEASWPMVAANPERTSWTSEEVRGQLYPVWYKPFEAFVPLGEQIIAANDLLYLSTAKGLYAIKAGTGEEAWVYPTEMPLGNSPTVTNGVAYVGGFDKRLYALNASTGKLIWTFVAEAGFDTNPLVVNNLVFAGNRDGYMYAVNADSGTLKWKYKTDGPIQFSAAYKDNTIYFASNDSYAYALGASTGQLVWKSSKLPGDGFHSWWPVLYRDSVSGADVVILAGSSRYRRTLAPGPGSSMDLLDRDSVFPNNLSAPKGTPVGPRQSDGWIDAHRITEYYENNPNPSGPDSSLLYKPWRRTYIVLNRLNGQEYTFDTDGDGHPEFAPILAHNTQSGNRYPPVVGVDNILYQTNDYMSNPWIVGGHVSGWRFGTPYISTPSDRWLPADEPAAYSAGGKLVYYSYWVGGGSGAFDVTKPNTKVWDNGDPGGPDASREWMYFEYNLESKVPVLSTIEGIWKLQNMVELYSGDVNPPIPYKGKVYMHVANSVIAFSPQAATVQRLPTGKIVPASAPSVPVANSAQIQAKLAAEVQKMLDAGHLRPGYFSSGLFDGQARQECGDNLSDYFHNPADTLYALLRALPYLSPDLQQKTKAYLQSEFASYPPYSVVHVGWKTGAIRESYDDPPEVQSDLVNYPATEWSSYDFTPWGGSDQGAKYPPYIFYALWKYAQTFGGAKTIFDRSKGRLEPVPSDAVLAEYPFVHNAYIAGYLGYLRLEQLAGYPQSGNVKTAYDRLLERRAATFSKDTPYTDFYHCQALSIARNFIFLVPELGDYLHDHALDKVQAALDEYTTYNPYWFVAKFEATAQEGTKQILYDYGALFQAKALILKEPQSKLSKYLDVPGFARGDLFYIHNLVALLESEGIPVAQAQVTKSASPMTVRAGGTVTYTLMASNLCSGNVTTTIPVTLTDRLPTGMNVNAGSCKSSATPVSTCSGTNVTWKGNLSPTGTVVISYTAQVITTAYTSLVNQMKVETSACDPYTDTAMVLANPRQVYLPLILKGVGQ
jgi:uncharacterized repeat protein (TIGR01451 family)